MHGCLFKDIHFPWLQTLNPIINDPLKLNNKINAFLINPNIISYYLEKINNIFQTLRFNHRMIFFKLTVSTKLVVFIYINHNNCLGHILVT